tara:strand:+ start:5139 stop:6170 length:1032 start_codon:yes stop_codon:yes gene_type:complete
MQPDFDNKIPQGFHIEQPEGFGYRLATGTIEHQRVKRGIQYIGELHHARRLHGQGGGILVTGPSGVGKTVLVSSYAHQFARQSSLKGTFVPVLMVTVPSAPTVKSLSETILMSFGHPKAHRGSAPEKTALILDLITRCGVEMLILDEFQHLYYSPTNAHFRDVTDWLKNLISQANVAVVACGLLEANSVVQANEQLRRRFSAHFRMLPFQLQDEADFQEFRAVLKRLQQDLPIPPCTPLHEANLARRLHLASYGLLDYVRKVLEGAVSICGRLGLAQITQEVLEAAFRERVWGEVPDRKNPFHSQAYLQPLDRPGEAFYLHMKDPSRSSVATTRTRLHVPKGR